MSKAFTSNCLYGQHTYLPPKMKYSRPEFYVNTTRSSQVLCSKHYISMYLDKNLTKLAFDGEKFSHKKYPHPLRPKIVAYIYATFSKYIILLNALNVRF